MLNIFLGTVLVSFSLVLIYPLVLTCLYGLVKKPVRKHVTGRDYSYGCIITAYRQLEVAVPLVKSLLAQNYKDHEIYLVADKCEKSEFPITNSALHVLFPDEALNSKLKSISFAIRNFNRPHNFTLIFDPDNLAPKNYLNHVNKFHRLGYAAVQSKRMPKNLDNYVACLDAAGEIYHNFIERLIPWKLGSSATISGSGMSIETGLYKDFLYGNEVQDKIHGVILGEDKMLQNFLVLKNEIIAFQEEAVLFDEKVTSNKQVKKQRTRWINAYFQNISAAFGIFSRGLKNFSFNQILFGVNTLYPPLFLLVLSALIALSLNIALSGNVHLSYLLIFALISFSLNFMLALFISGAPPKVIRSIFFVPVFMANQVLSLLNLKKSRNDFLVTEKKTSINIEELDQ